MFLSKFNPWFGSAALAAACFVACGGGDDTSDPESGGGGSSGSTSGASGKSGKGGGSSDGGAETGSAGDEGSGGSTDPSGGSDGTAGDGTAGDGTSAGGNGAGGAPGGGPCGLPAPVGSCDDRENVFPTCVEYYQGDPGTAEIVCHMVEGRTWTTGQGCTTEGLAGVCTLGSPGNPFQSNYYYEEDPERAQACEDAGGDWCEP